MGKIFAAKNKPGFQTSHTTGVEVTVYSHADDPILSGKNGEVFAFRGRNEKSDSPSVFSVSTDKTLGAAAGTLTVEVKDPGNLTRVLADDDWIDISFISGGHIFHTMRGVVESFRESETTGPNGATVKTVQITGRDFGVVFDKTKIWFNQFRAENAGFSKTIDIFGALNAAGTPVQCVERILFGFLETLATSDPPRANWLLPKGMPGRQETFPDTVLFVAQGFRNDPERYAVDQQLMDPSGQGVWNLAQEWSDPQFCELFCDLAAVNASPLTNEEAALNRLLNAGGRDEVSADVFFGNLQMQPHREYRVEDTGMAVFFRDRPFPTLRDGRGSPWFKLPTAELAPQDIVQRNLGRGGTERFNAFFAAPRAIQQLNAAGLDLVGPLWDVESVARHGLRDFSVDSRYIATENNLFTMSEAMRQIARDFHCLNPYFWNGTLALGSLRPDIRVGQRLRVRGSSSDEDITFYVEQVTHNWRLTSARTTVGVTRGWIGTDDSYMTALERVAARYTLLPGDDEPARATTPVRLPGISDQIPP